MANNIIQRVETHLQELTREMSGPLRPYWAAHRIAAPMPTHDNVMWTKTQKNNIRLICAEIATHFATKDQLCYSPIDGAPWPRQIGLMPDFWSYRHLWALGSIAYLPRELQWCERTGESDNEMSFVLEFFYQLNAFDHHGKLRLPIILVADHPNCLRFDPITHERRMMTGWSLDASHPADRDPLRSNCMIVTYIESRTRLQQPGGEWYNAMRLNMWTPHHWQDRGRLTDADVEVMLNNIAVYEDHEHLRGVYLDGNRLYSSEEYTD